MVRDADWLVLTNTATAESRSFVVLPLSSLIGGSPVQSVCLAQTTTLQGVKHRKARTPGRRRSLNSAALPRSSRSCACAPSPLPHVSLSPSTHTGSRWVPAAKRQRRDDGHPSSFACCPRPPDGRTPICECVFCLAVEAPPPVARPLRGEKDYYNLGNMQNR